MKLTKKWFERYGSVYEMNERQEFRFEVVSQYYVFMGFHADTRAEALEFMYTSLSKSVWDEVEMVELEK
jgi:hypothetical protein